jgi:hypothetical protein
MQEAYRRAIGMNTTSKHWLDAYYNSPAHQNSKDRYYSAIHPGWVCFGTWWDCPKDATYIGRCGSVYAWVPNEKAEELSQFTLAILDIATASTGGAGVPGAGVSKYGAAPEALPSRPFFTPRENFFNPFVIQGPLPIP